MKTTTPPPSLRLLPKPVVRPFDLPRRKPNIVNRQLAARRLALALALGSLGGIILLIAPLISG